MNSTNRNFGLHLRLIDSYTGIVKDAIEKDSEIFQLFLLPEKGSKHLAVSSEDKNSFFELKKNIKNIYIHSSYKINLSTGKKKLKEFSKYILEKEFEIASELEINNIVIHPGNYTGYSDKKRAIESFMTTINNLILEYPNINVIIENTAHGNSNVGSDLKDFILMRRHVKNQVYFCIDFAHAYVYGYDISKVDNFIQTLDKTMGLDNIKLIHLNDTNKPLGSKLDAHSPPGSGIIGKDVLTKLISHKKLQNTPVIIELPSTQAKNGKTILKDIRAW